MRNVLSPFKGIKQTHVLIEYDSAGEMVAETAKFKSCACVNRWIDRDKSFFSNEDFSSASAKAVSGDKELAERVKRIINEIQRGKVATVQRKRISRPMGRAVVGAYLASDPMPCRGHVKVKTAHAPITIAVNVTSSAAARSSDLEKRGIAIAALVQALAKVRPVKLLLCGMACSHNYSEPQDNGVIWTCKFPTAPVDTYRLAWLLSSQGFARLIGFMQYNNAQQFFAAHGIERKDRSDHSSIRWLQGQSYENGKSGFEADFRAYCRDDLFYIPGAGTQSSDYDQMLRDPVAWINATVARLST